MMEFVCSLFNVTRLTLLLLVCVEVSSVNCCYRSRVSEHIERMRCEAFTSLDPAFGASIHHKLEGLCTRALDLQALTTTTYRVVAVTLQAKVNTSISSNTTQAN